MAIRYVSLGALLGTGALDLEGASLRLVAVDIGAGGYTAVRTHQFLSEIDAGDRIATSDLLTGVSVSSGYFKCDPIEFPTPSGSAEALVLIQDSGSAATSELLVYMDSTDVAGLPVTFNGVDSIMNIASEGLFEV